MTGPDDRSGPAVTGVARSQLDDVNRRVARLTAIKSELERMIAACDGGRVEQCRIIEILADHSHAR